MAKQYQHLSLGERSLIQTQLLQGFNPSAIAKNLGRQKWPRSFEQYSPIYKWILYSA